MDFNVPWTEKEIVNSYGDEVTERTCTGCGEQLMMRYGDEAHDVVACLRALRARVEKLENPA